MNLTPRCTETSMPPAAPKMNALALLVCCHSSLPRTVSRICLPQQLGSPKPCQKSYFPSPKSKTCWQWGLNSNTTPRRCLGLLKIFWIHCLELSSCVGLVLRTKPTFPVSDTPNSRKGLELVTLRPLAVGWHPTVHSPSCHTASWGL